MSIPNLFKGSRAASLVWITLSLGSCAYYQHVDSRTFVFTLQEPTQKNICAPFKRTIHIGHVRPMFPKVNMDALSNDEVTDLLLSYAERLKTYLDNDERYLVEDLTRHQSTCVNDL